MPSAQVVSLRDKLLLLDCGEGTQLQWRYTGLNWQKLAHIFITHAHGDHLFGLPGLLSTMALLGRTQPLFIHGPETIRPFLDCVLQQFCATFDYEVHYLPVDTTRHAIVHEDRSMQVWSLPLQHRVPCCGYLVREQPGQPHIRRDRIDFYNVPTWAIGRIKMGHPWHTPDGRCIPATELTTPPDPVRAYAYCSDTLFTPALADMVGSVDVLYHEATYASTEADRAAAYGHSTAAQAAEMARRAGAGKLIIGHFSSRYDDEQILLQEAQAIFPDTILAEEHMQVQVLNGNSSK